MKERLWRILYNIPNKQINELNKMKNLLKIKLYDFPENKMNYLENLKVTNNYIINLNI